ncbi:MAG: hypothetical protein K9G38_08085 [Bacteroidales bacterium]|nr:hypothetical protein [Bacteroidales bacterium]
MSLKNIVPFALLIIAVSGPAALKGQSTDDFINTLITRIDAYLFEDPADNVYIHTDRTVYFPGQSMMFRAVVTDASTLLPATHANTCVLHLLSAEGEEEMSLSVEVLDGYGYGNMLIPESLEQGLYTLLGYVKSGDVVTVNKPFTREIIIADPGRQIVMDHNVEGGPYDITDEVVADIRTYAENSWCFSRIRIDYEVFADEQVVGTGSGKTEKDGSFSIRTKVPDVLPENMYIRVKAYKRKVENQFNICIPLYKPKEKQVIKKTNQGIALNVHGISNNRLKVSTAYSKRYDPEEPVVIAIFRKGLLYWSAPGTLGGSAEISLPLARVPSGILDIVLMDPAGKLLAETPVYYERANMPGIDVQLDRDEYHRRGLVKAVVTFSKAFDVFPEGSALSVSVVPEVLLPGDAWLLDDHMLINTELQYPSAKLLQSVKGLSDGDPMMVALLGGFKRTGYDREMMLKGDQKRVHMTEEQVFKQVEKPFCFPSAFRADRMEDLSQGIRDRRMPSAQQTNYKNQLEAGMSVPEVIMSIKPYTMYGSKIIFAGKVNSFQSQQGALIVIDGQPVGQDASLLKAIQPQEVETIRVSTSVSDINKYTGDNSVGIIEVTLKGYQSDTKMSDRDKRDQEIMDAAGSYLPGYPDYSLEKDVKSIQTDHRNLLYWNPDLKPLPDDETTFEFYTSDLPGSYVITVQGMIGAHPVAVRKSFEVR